LPARHRAGARGFTLIEMMAVLAILGILAAIAIGAYARQIRRAHKSEVISDLSNLTLRQNTFRSVSGHFASSRNSEGDTYPTTATISVAGDPVKWDISDPGYTASGISGNYGMGGEALHGFDVLRFLPEGGSSLCGYATISGYGENAIDPADPEATLGITPPSSPLANAIFPTGAEDYYSSDWFYSYALCDFDFDGTYAAFTTAHYTSDISSESIGSYVENE
jgi:prepilin-type N-terminal cleavage/methylation domain-containing protein